MPPRWGAVVSAVALLAMMTPACSVPGGVTGDEGGGSIGADAERFCGSYRLYSGGRRLARDETPMAEVLRSGRPIHGAEAIVERPDGSVTLARSPLAK